MANTRAAQRYAKAILELAKEKAVWKEVNSDFRLLENTLKENKNLANILKSPVVKASDKQAILNQIFTNVDAITQNTFGVLIENGRIALIQDVVKQFIRLYDEDQNIKVAHVTTATALTPAMHTKLLDKVKQLTGSEATLTNAIDESILGGFILRVGDLQYDASVAGKLNSLKKKFNQNAYI